ncbi:MAG: hypothetical protein OXF39_01635 [Nitrospira sp.]|nr:hypothetical protein [Nitrospira sp.]
MTPQPTLRIAGIRGVSTRFKRLRRKLSPEADSQLRQVLNELMTGTLTPGRNLEKLPNLGSLYSVRLNKTARLVFELKKDHMIFVVAVGSHDAAYRPS